MHFAINMMNKKLNAYAAEYGKENDSGDSFIRRRSGYDFTQFSSAINPQKKRFSLFLKAIALAPIRLNISIRFMLLFLAG